MRSKYGPGSTIPALIRAKPSQRLSVKCCLRVSVLWVNSTATGCSNKTFRSPFNKLEVGAVSSIDVGKDMGETMHGDLLNAWVCGNAILGGEAAFGVLVAIKVDHAHAQGTE